MILFRELPDRGRRFILFTARGVSVSAGIFTFIVSILMIADYVQLAAGDPLDAPVLATFRERYIEDPDTPGIADDIRALDFMARRAYFTRRRHLRTGTFLLIGGAVVLVAALRTEALVRRSPLPPGSEGSVERRSGSRLALAGAGVFMFAAALSSSLLSRSIEFPVPTGKAGLPAVSEPFPEGYETNWPAFRGPYGNGLAFEAAPPTAWDGRSGLNIRWKAPVAAGGFSSPVVWGDRIFLTGGNRDGQFVSSYQAADGALLWERRIGPFPGSPASPVRVTDDTGYAAASPAVDGELVFVIYASGDIAALDADGNTVWGRNLGVPDNHYGHSSSLITFGDTLIVLFDHALSTGLYALDRRTGRERWRADRDTQITWSSPVLAEIAEGWSILVNANPFFAAYSAVDGRELYRFEGILGEVASSPGYGGGAVIVVNQIMSIISLGLEDGTMMWELYDDLPDVTSPLVVDPYLFIATSFGTLLCIDIGSGDVVWREEFDEGFYSSPVYAGGSVYLFDRSGKARVFEAADEYRELSASVLGEGVVSTPAFTRGAMFVRGEENLYCVEAPE